jgi:hypothetical protein
MDACKLFSLYVLVLNGAFALAPPFSKELCDINGEVLSKKIEKSLNSRLVSQEFEILTLKILSIKKSKIVENSYVTCENFEAGKRYKFKNCLNAKIKVNQIVSGVVGRGKGGGRICVDIKD